MTTGNSLLSTIKEASVWAALGYGVGAGSMLVMLILANPFLSYGFDVSISLNTMVLASSVVGLASSASFTVLWFFILYDADADHPSGVDVG